MERLLIFVKLVVTVAATTAVSEIGLSMDGPKSMAKARAATVHIVKSILGILIFCRSLFVTKVSVVAEAVVITSVAPRLYGR